MHKDLHVSLRIYILEFNNVFLGVLNSAKSRNGTSYIASTTQRSYTINVANIQTMALQMRYVSDSYSIYDAFCALLTTVTS